MKVLRVYCWSCRNVSHVTGVGFYLLCSHISRPCPRPADWQTQEVTSTNQLINTDPTKLLVVFVPVLLTLWVIYLCTQCFWAQKALELVMLVIHGVSLTYEKVRCVFSSPEKRKTYIWIFAFDSYKQTWKARKPLHPVRKKRLWAGSSIQRCSS